MAYKGSDNSIPRISVQEQNGEIVCVIDLKTEKRYGPVLISNRKQGLHLFSVGYCLTSMAASYCRPKADYMSILGDLINRFHPNFMTKLLVNAKFRKKHTFFHRDWRDYLNQMLEAYQSLHLAYKSGKKGDFYHDDLEEYLNFAGALQHILPCNVAFSHDASDPEGGEKAKRAIQSIYGLSLKGETVRQAQIESNISDIVDYLAVEGLFENGFDGNGVWCLAYIILQIEELQSLYKLESRDYNPSFLTHRGYNQTEEGVQKHIPFQKHPPTSDREQYSRAFSDAIGKICSIRELVVRSTSMNKHQEIITRIAHELC